MIRFVEYHKNKETFRRIVLGWQIFGKRGKGAFFDDWGDQNIYICLFNTWHCFRIVFGSQIQPNSSAHYQTKVLYSVKI